MYCMNECYLLLKTSKLLWAKTSEIQEEIAQSDLVPWIVLIQGTWLDMEWFEHMV